MNPLSIQIFTKTIRIQRFAIMFVLCGSYLISPMALGQDPTTSSEPPKTAVDKSPTLAISALSVLGMDLLSADLNSVRKQLWDIGGFQQAKSTVLQRNIDKFFPWSNLRDSYYIEFRYNNAGKITSVKRLFRPYSLEITNQRSAIQTKDIALTLIPEIGQPTQVARKGVGGSLSYQAYTWDDDKMRIIIDREGSEKLGNVFIEYTIKGRSPYEVAKI